MKKALLITWYNGTNYGTLLQAYCLKKILENPEITELPSSKGCNFNLDVSLLSYIPGIEKKSFFKKINNFIFSSSEKKIKTIKRVFSRKYEKKFANGLPKRENVFEKFRKEQFKFYPQMRVQNKKELEQINNFDYYIIGSDQVWNPNMLDDAYLLNWVKSDNKISYAPSVCVNEIPLKSLDLYKALEEFKAISVREENNVVEQLSNFLNKDINVVVDPVVLFGREALLKYCKNDISESYVLSYFLGVANESREYFINFCETNKMIKKSIIAVNPLNLSKDIELIDFSIWEIDPLELINEIYNSQYVITDSFHIMVLAILLHKDFSVLPREKGKSQQNNRILNFLKIVGLEERFNLKEESILDVKIQQEKWEMIDKILEQKREYSFRYLKNAIIE